MSISFTTHTTSGGQWRAWSNNEYDDSMQPIAEIIDNSIAAKATEIRVILDFENSTGSIEDNGKGFPIDTDGLSRCFTYSPEYHIQTDLNEHGCGLKSSLAILDPNNKIWSITWRTEHSDKIYNVHAPYKCTHMVEERNEWPGYIKGEKHGTFISFPIKKDRFSSLYKTKHSKMNDDDVIKRVMNILSHYWMKYPLIVSGAIKLFVNNQEVNVLTLPYDNPDYITNMINYREHLQNGAMLHITHFFLVSDIKGTCFKKTLDASGFYLYKNGRFIQKITDGQIYTQLTGSRPHNSGNGNIVIVNMEGPQEYLPRTVPTKNKFKPSDNPIFDEIINILSNKIRFKRVTDKEESEEQLMSKFQEIRVNGHSDSDTVFEFWLKEQFTFEDQVSPQIDAVEINDKKGYVYEAKTDKKISQSHLLQLYGNWILSMDPISERYPSVKDVIPVLIVNNDDKDVISDTLKARVKRLSDQSKDGFPLQIWNYKSKILYKNK